jgi:hypothetical protein
MERGILFVKFMLRYDVQHEWVHDFIRHGQFWYRLGDPQLHNFFILRDCRVWTQFVKRSGQKARAKINRWRHRATLTFVARNSLVPHQGTVLTNTRQTTRYFLITLRKVVQQMPSNDTLSLKFVDKIESHNFKGDWNLTKNVRATRCVV